MSARRFIGIWLVLAMVMSLNGVIREAVLVRVLGRTLSDIVSAALGMTAIVAVTWRLLRAVHLSPAGAMEVGAVWAAMAAAFDLVVGHYVDGKTWTELLNNYAIWRGRLWPVVLGLVLVAPLVWCRGRRFSPRGSRQEEE